MLAANVCSAKFLEKNKHKALYRIHEGPTPEKLDNLRKALRLLGLALEGGEKPTTKDYAVLASQLESRPDAAMVQTLLLRSMQQAVYSPDNVGHFGLAYEAYTHFTSPIRRYPDLLVHRAIKAVLKGETYKPGKWAKLGMQCSMTERRADDASRDVESWLKTYYMRDKVGEVFTGKISAVTSFGVFVLLDELYVEGLVHISELGKDYFHYKQEMQAIVGEKSGMRYQLGDAMTVRVARVDLDATQVDFVLFKDEEEVADKKPRSRSRKTAQPAAPAAPAEPAEKPAGKTAAKPAGDRPPRRRR